MNQDYSIYSPLQYEGVFLLCFNEMKYFLFVSRFNIIRVKKVVVIIWENQFENYIKQYQRLIITICFSFTKNYFDAEDIAQQTFLTAYKNMNKLRRGSQKLH